MLIFFFTVHSNSFLLRSFPTWNQCHDLGLDHLDQPEPLVPLTLSSPEHSPAASELCDVSDEQVAEENKMFHGHNLPHLASSPKVPPPVRHIAAPDPMDIPLPASSSARLPSPPLPAPPAPVAQTSLYSQNRQDLDS